MVVELAGKQQVIDLSKSKVEARKEYGIRFYTNPHPRVGNMRHKLQALGKGKQICRTTCH